MNSLKQIVAAATLAATAFGGVATSAQAGDWNRGGYGYGYGYGGYAPRHYAPAPRYYGHGHGYGHERRDRRGERIATGVAIGVGAIILGSILANQSRRHGYRGY
jgi:hypothetical protein